MFRYDAFITLNFQEFSQPAVKDLVNGNLYFAILLRNIGKIYWVHIGSI